MPGCLAPLAHLLARDYITDIYVNRPGEVWIEHLGGATERHEAPQLTARVLERLARQIAATTAQGVSREHPLLAAALPDGSRVQIVLPPATRGHIALAIRKHVAAGMTLDDYVRLGAFSETRLGDPASRHDLRQAPGETGTDDIAAMLRHAVLLRRNILISGGTSSGKTTFLNALLNEIPREERLILIEDTACSRGRPARTTSPRPAACSLHQFRIKPSRTMPMVSIHHGRAAAAA